MENYVMITLEQYRKLLIDSHLLAALQGGGVDSWEWYGEALGDYCKELGGDIDELVQRDIDKMEAITIGKEDV